MSNTGTKCYNGNPTDTAAADCLSSLKVEMDEHERMSEKRIGY